MPIWKWGCNFGGRHTPSHRDCLEVNQIVLGDTHWSNYQLGDLVAVTEGYTVFAIARITGAPVPITQRSDLNPPQVYGIAIANHIVVAPVQWKNINPTYQLPIQPGHRQVRKPEHVNALNEIWENTP